MLREPITTLAIPKKYRGEKSYALHVSIVAKDGDWKSRWIFEGFGVTQQSTSPSTIKLSSSTAKKSK